VRRAHSHHDLETVEALGLGALDLGRESLDEVLVDDAVGLRRSARDEGEGTNLSRDPTGLTAAKKARTCSMKYRSLSLSLFSQSWRSGARLISSEVQKLREA
jgi:hypothetical protein